jgi:saccharopine dehydrogenase-like NADP-dependent oxidoreductase
MKAAIVGTGRMGRAIAWAMDRLGSDELVLVDYDTDNLHECSEGVSCPATCFLAGVRPNDLYPPLTGCDIVISAMPYHQNENLARHCIDHKMPYCDLGGHVGTSYRINEYAKENHSLVMTDLGLAPGWVNILAEHGYNSQEHNPQTVEMMVGGLPIVPDNYLKYNCTWSYEGLINEYKDRCDVLTDGRITLADGMSGLIYVETDLGMMEAFYTSGGASHTIGTMQKRGIQDCHYRTLRYPGHCEAMKFLMDNISSDQELVSFLTKACPPAPDLVIIKARVDDWEEEKVVYSNYQFSAMQMATAFPLSVVAKFMGNGAFRSCRHPFGAIDGPMSYEDIPYGPFSRKLHLLFEEAK